MVEIKRNIKDLFAPLVSYINKKDKTCLSSVTLTILIHGALFSTIESDALFVHFPMCG